MTVADPEARGSIAYAIQDFDRTGAMRAPYQVLRGFTSAGWEARIVTVASEANAAIDEVWGNVPVERVGRLGGRRSRVFRLFLRMLIRSRSELVISWVWYWHALGLALARIALGRPYIICLDSYCYQAAWDMEGWHSRIHARLRYGTVLKAADLVIAETPTAAWHARQIVREDRVQMIPVCLWRRALEEVEARWARSEASLAREPVVLYAGRVARRKNLHDLIRAFGGLSERFPDWRLEIIGPVAEQDYYRELRALVNALGLAHSIRFGAPSYGEALYRRLRTSAVFALPSSGEGMPSAVLEAMYFGGAIVAGRSGSVGYQLNDGECGLLFEPGDLASLTEHLDRLMSSPVLRDDLMRRARTRMCRHFDWDLYFPALNARVLALQVGS
ncbi:MAG: glycosyltransferase family 4 protein [Caldilineae bacterium]|nr:glycosyltransferase family 4 protein [Caldilineae bacterium]